MRLALILAILIAAINTANGASLNNIDFYAVRFPPYQEVSQDGSLAGETSSIINNILQDKMVNMSTTDINFIDINTLHKSAKDNHKGVYIGVPRTDDLINKFQWIKPIVKTDIVIIADRKVNKTRLHLDEINDKTIAVIKHSTSQLALSTSPYAVFNNILEVPSISSVIRMLNHDRVDYWAHSSVGALHAVGEIGTEKKYEVIKSVEFPLLWIAVTKNTSKEIITVLNAVADKHVPQ